MTHRLNEIIELCWPLWKLALQIPILLVSAASILTILFKPQLASQSLHNLPILFSVVFVLQFVSFNYAIIRRINSDARIKFLVVALSGILVALFLLLGIKQVVQPLTVSVWITSIILVVFSLISNFIGLWIFLTDE